jgi:hypothetical protein
MTIRERGRGNLKIRNNGDHKKQGESFDYFRHERFSAHFTRKKFLNT